MAPIYDKTPCNCPEPPATKCYYWACIKGDDSNFSGWTINGQPFTAANIATAYGGGGYIYTAAAINPTPPPTPDVLNAIGWLFQPSTDPLPVVTIKDNFGNVINAPIKECCELTCWEIFVPKTSARLNAVTFHACQVEYVNYAIQTDPAGTQTAINAMLSQIYPPGATAQVITEATGKRIVLKNLYACTANFEVIDDNNIIFSAVQVPC